ncbi:MAG TPA: NAD(+) synthase [Candidatus Sulfotelmatobacter sp.]|nr:NAD(+) synthase [Candidatus Sulfotelmatobacter sp.]
MTVASLPDTNLLQIDAAAETESIAAAIREIVLTRFRRKGAVVAVSGGIDSSVVASLCVRALGAENVIVLFLPETDSSGESLRLGKLLSSQLGVRAFEENISAILEGAGCYRRRDEAICAVVPEFGPGYKSKIVLPNMVAADTYAVFSLVVQSPAGETKKLRLPLDSYLGIVAASNFKQRTRKMMEYYYADRYHYAVAGTPNRLEYDQGFFVKNGDGAADFKPIAHLYKSQVYQLAAYLNVPDEIQRRPPTTDTYSLEQSQEEFYFSMPLAKMDICLYGKDHGITPAELAPIAGFTEEQVKRAYQMIDSKRRVARYLRDEPVLVQPVSE